MQTGADVTSILPTVENVVSNWPEAVALGELEGFADYPRHGAGCEALVCQRGHKATQVTNYRRNRHYIRKQTWR